MKKNNNNQTFSAFGLIYASCSVSLSHIARYTLSFNIATPAINLLQNYIKAILEVTLSKIILVGSISAK